MWSWEEDDPGEAVGGGGQGYEVSGALSLGTTLYDNKYIFHSFSYIFPSIE